MQQVILARGAEQEIHRSAVAYIRRTSMNQDQWKFTRLGELHSQLYESLSFAPEEGIIVSSFVSPESWYVFTTRRFVSKYAGVLGELEAIQIVGKEFGNFKGHVPKLGAGALPTQVATVTHAESGANLQFEFETLYASMAPIYACKFWERRAKRLRGAASTPGASHAQPGA